MRDPLEQIEKPDGAEPDAGGGYNRPNQPWVCGNTGSPCPFGPSPRGACPKLAECRPVQHGDRWVCNRSARRGGPCDNDEGCDGPTPDGQCGRVHHCTPARSLRTTRRRVAVGAGVFLAGALAMVLGSNRGPSFAAPGALTHAHARLMTATDVSRCANCHPGGGDSLAGHATAALVGLVKSNGREGPPQSELCLNCHEKEFGREHALLAHGLPASSFPNSHLADTSVACAVCHQEHQGADHNLAALSNQRCQACHQQRFDSLAGSHPDFGVWPYRRRTRIAFDHARHEGIHFAKEQAKFNCSQCHTEGANGNVATIGFETACASCHESKINRSLAEGVSVLALPTLDAEALAAAGREPGAWSENALGDFDGDLPAPMKLLLAADPNARSAMRQLGEDFSFYDLDPADPQHAEHAVVLAGAIRKLVGEIARNGQTEIASRLQGQAEAAAGLPPTLVSRVWWQWFRDLEAKSQPPRNEQAAKLAGGGWFSDTSTLSLRYAATGHADRVLTAWLNAAAALGDDQQKLRRVALAELNRSGGCLDCHSVEETGTGKLAINWRGLDTTLAPRTFTRFSHTPHLTQPELADCRGCHQFTEPASSAVDYAGYDPRAFVSHFEPISKTACVGCHQPKLAGDRCTQCHNYHVQDIPDFGLRIVD